MSTPTISAGGQPAGGATRCTLTELLIPECGHCRPPVPKVMFSHLLPEGPEELGPYVLARWPGRCADCGQRHGLDEWIRSDGHGGWLAECCGGDA